MRNKLTFSKLLEPGNIGHIKLKNRLVRTAAGVDYLDKEYFVRRERELPLYEALARGGVGLIILGGTVVEHPLGSVTPTNVRFDDDKFIPGFREVTEVVHKYNCPIFLQIHHAGPWHGIFNVMTNEVLQPVSASGLSRSELQVMGMDFGLQLRELTVAEIKEQVNKWADAAVRGRKAGFDGIELNVATCHLGNSFLSRAWNRRHDEYGVDNLENRTRFVVEVLQEIKKRLGLDFPVGVLMNGAEFGIDNGLTIKESQGIARIFEKAGTDYIQVRTYGYGEYWDLHVPESIFFPEPPKPLAKPLDGSRHGAGVVIPLAAEIKKVVSVPVIAVGRLDPELGEAILEGGRADFIAMQRRLIADPELTNKVAEGRLKDIAPCTACLGCFAAMERHEPVRCRINAAMGGTQDYIVDKTLKKKRVVVIGGGPAGMEAARVAALRGHEVMLYEKEHKLGGLLPLASLVKNARLENLEDIIRYLKAQITKFGVNIKLGKEFNPSFVDKVKPDVVIIATGGIPTVPDIPGIKGNNVIGMPRLHEMMKRYLRYLKLGALRSLTRLWMPIGKKVVIMGGGVQGLELAEFLARAGRKISIVDTAETLHDDRWAGVQNLRVTNWLASKGVRMLTGVKYEEITDKGLTITTKEGIRKTIEADSIIPVIPLAPNSKLAESLQGKVAEVYSIGDCAQPGLIMDAIADGYRVARGL